MDAALVTVGDELLSGDTENTNATWLARRLTERGVSVERVVVVPDEEAVIARYVRRWSDSFDAVVTTGGLGGTHDDVTMAGVARAFDRSLVVDETARADVEATVESYREANPDRAERYELRIDVEAQSALPEGARVLLNPEGLSPGCVCGNVYVLPGIPDEMRAMFDVVADEFGGEVVSESLYTPAPEGALYEQFRAVTAQFDVTVGSYPALQPAPNRVKVVGTDRGTVRAAADWLAARIDTVDPPAATGADAPEGSDGSDAAPDASDDG
jgi:molybdenum cofactor synthesis domain-containing protein